MLDTNICIYVMKGRLQGVSDRFAQHSHQICISTITLAELQYGAEKSARRPENIHALEEFAGRLSVLPFSAAAAVHFGELLAHLERAGTPASSPDVLIGAHARSEGLVLVTNNRREFDRMPGLSVENWLGPPGEGI